MGTAHEGPDREALITTASQVLDCDTSSSLAGSRGRQIIGSRPAAHRETSSSLAAGVFDVNYRIVDSPIGSLLLAATPEGVVRIAFEREDHDTVLGVLADRVSPRILRAPARLDAAARQLDEYFAGTRQSFDIPVDLRLAVGFRRVVLKHLRSIAFGTTQSYSVVAAHAGSPTAVRAVGSACATNPVPVVVPCHRVVRSDATLGQYLGGVEAKRALLALEVGPAPSYPGEQR